MPIGEDIGFTEVMRFRVVLKEAVEKIRDNPTDDSPVYTFLKGLRPPSLEKVMESVAVVKEVAGIPGQPGASLETLSVLMQQVDAAQKR